MGSYPHTSATQTDGYDVRSCSFDGQHSFSGREGEAGCVFTRPPSGPPWQYLWFSTSGTENVNLCWRSLSNVFVGGEAALINLMELFISFCCWTDFTTNLKSCSYTLSECRLTSDNEH